MYVLNVMFENDIFYWMIYDNLCDGSNLKAIIVLYWLMVQDDWTKSYVLNWDEFFYRLGF
jgi:hypothetical protein